VNWWGTREDPCPQRVAATFSETLSPIPRLCFVNSPFTPRASILDHGPEALLMCRFELLSLLILFFQERFQRPTTPMRDE
jgi:hypothetical protein